mmetsp:Transcript_119844/g.208000  ORF Transcript_119844/g.208000 Transcript_119844/m.208000 type:complete len:85 (-) Transcript_119844:80-334(-)
MPSLRLLLFGPAREAADAGHVEVEFEAGGTVSELRKAVEAQCSVLADILTLSKFSVEQELIQDEASCKIKEGAEVALIPPISGG